jgi:YjbE family integral membrane protein
MQGFSIADVFTAAGLATLGQVILIDLIFSGDNAMVLGALTAGLQPKQRKQILGLGVVMAMVCLIGFALIATQLLQVVGLLFAGGLLLLWVAWKLWREIGPKHAPTVYDDPATPEIEGVKGKTFGQAAIQVAITNLSLSLDNVLAVAGAAREHPAVLLFGLGLSVTLMAVAANFIAKVIDRYRWTAYIGLVVILYVAGSMVYHGLIDRDVGVLKLIGL